MTITTKQILELAQECNLVGEHIDFNALSCTYDKDDVSEVDLDTLREEVEQYISESINVIYYSNAIAFLAEHDPSLTDSLEIAAEYDTPLKNINSEFLATILLQKMVSEEFSDYMSELEELNDVEAA